MASILKGRIKRYPSGMTSVIVSQICSGSSLGSRAKLRQRPIVIQMKIIECASFQNWARIALPAGNGGLGRKKRASWKTLRNARERMAAIEQVYGVANCGFLTITLPSVDVAAFEALARFSSYAMDRLNRILTRFFACKTARVSVWEYQSRGALHCHLLIASNRIHAIKKEEIIVYVQKAWYRILSDIGKKWGCNMFLGSCGKTRTLEELKAIKNKDDENVFVNFQIVRKSIVAYLSRYLADSNHDKNKKNKNALREMFYPIATWIQWNKNATECYEDKMDEFDLGECEMDKKPMLYQMIQALKKRIVNGVPLARDTEVKEPENPYNCGLYVIPANPESSKLSKLLVSFIEKISSFFSKDLSEKYNLHFKPISHDEMDIKLTLEHIDIERYRDKQKALKPLGFDGEYCGKNLANLGVFMLDLSLAFIDRFKPINYAQVELDYGF